MALLWGQRPVYLAAEKGVARVIYCSVTHYLTLRHLIHSCLLYLSVCRSGIQQLPSWAVLAQGLPSGCTHPKAWQAERSAPSVTHLAVGRKPQFPSQGHLCRVTRDMAAGFLLTEGWKNERATMWQLNSLVWLNLRSDTPSFFLCSLGHTDNPWYRVGGAHKGVYTRRQGSLKTYWKPASTGVFPQKFFKCVCAGSCLTHF